MFKLRFSIWQHIQYDIEANSAHRRLTFTFKQKPYQSTVDEAKSTVRRYLMMLQIPGLQVSGVLFTSSAGVLKILTFHRISTWHGESVTTHKLWSADWKSHVQHPNRCDLHVFTAHPSTRRAPNDAGVGCNSWGVGSSDMFGMLAGPDRVSLACQRWSVKLNFLCRQGWNKSAQSGEKVKKLPLVLYGWKPWNKSGSGSWLFVLSTSVFKV